jgi:transposase
VSALLRLRPLTDEEIRDLRTMAHGQKVEARLRDRARICWLSHQGQQVREIVALTGGGDATVRHWITRFNAQGLTSLTDAPRMGRPPTYTPEEIGVVIATSLTRPDELGLPFGSWTLDRLEAYLNEHKRIPIKRSRIGEILQAEGLRWRTQETWFGDRPDPAFAAKRGQSSPSTRRHRTAVS